MAAFLNAVVLSGELQFQYSHFCVGLVINYVQILKKFLFQMTFMVTFEEESVLRET